MTTNEELNEVVTGFRAAEDSLRMLTDEAQKLRTAASALGDADDAVRESAVSLTDTAEKVTDMSVQLGTLASQLATATDALAKADPEGTKRELGKNVEQVERLRSRVDETAGETRSGFDSIGKSLAQVKLLAGAAMVFAIIAVGLMLALR